MESFGDSVTLYNPEPRVSVVIPTIGRKNLTYAIESVLNQTFQNFEILICLGAQVELKSVQTFIPPDARIRVIIPKQDILNANVARNAGIFEARGSFVAFLDDDDKWAIEKLEKQIVGIGEMDFSATGITEVDLKKSSAKSFNIWPKSGERLAEYLFVRRTFANKNPRLQTSTLMIRAEVAKKNPLKDNLTVHQDWDYILDLESKGYNFVYVPDALTQYATNSSNNTSSRTSWKESLAWAYSVQGILTRLEFSHLLLGMVSSRAAKAGAYLEALRLVGCAVRIAPSFYSAKAVIVALLRIPFLLANRSLNRLFLVGGKK